MRISAAADSRGDAARIAAGYLIVRTYEALYRRFARPADRPIYSVPVKGVAPVAVPKRYRGIDREPLQAWTKQELQLGWPGVEPPASAEQEACLFLADLERRGGAVDELIVDWEGAKETYERLRSPRERELIWVTAWSSQFERVDGDRLGFDAASLRSDYFSAICDTMCFPRWHGTDAEGTLFLRFHERLNQHALFDTVDDAREFLSFYRSLDWAETGDFTIAEIWRPAFGSK